MSSFFRMLFTPPVFENDEEKTRSAAIMYPVLLGTILLLVGYQIFRMLTGRSNALSLTTLFLIVVALTACGLLLMVRRGHVKISGYIYVTIGWIGLTFQAWSYSGLRDVAVIAYTVVILAAGLLIGLRSSIGYAALSLLAAWIFALFETYGKYNGLGDSPYPTAIELTVIFVLVAILSYISVNNLNQALNKSRMGERELRANNEELKVLHSDLEKRVEERTTDLERRTIEIQTAAQIARDASTAQNVETLLGRTVQLVQTKFGYYHIGIYLIDDNGEYAVLTAAGSEAGKLMLASNVKVSINDPDIIGRVARSGEPRIIIDTANDTTHRNNPLLPYTRSEIAMPLKAEGRIIGVLDIQSDKAYTFDQDSVPIMQIITDQISVAIDRIRLLQELQQNTRALERALQENTARTWRSFLEQISKRPGFRYGGVTVESLVEPSRESRTAIRSGERVVLTGDESAKTGSSLAVPIQLRGQTLGALNIQFQGSSIPSETLTLVEEAANRLALALENARLVQDAQRLAKREQQINTISAQIQQSSDMEIVLQNTIRELGNALGVPKTFIQIGLTTPDNQ